MDTFHSLSHEDIRNALHKNLNTLNEIMRGQVGVTVRCYSCHISIMHGACMHDQLLIILC